MVSIVIGKHVVVTGGEGELGIVVSNEFRSAGYEVESPGRNRLDVCDAGSIRGFFDTHPCDILVCCAGLATDSLIARMALQDWDLLWRTNYQGAKQCAEAALPSMIHNGGGHIIFLSSHSAFHPPAGQSAYSAAKRALIGLSRDLAFHHGKDHIRINAVLPGFLENRMTSFVSLDRKKEVLENHALGRLNTMDRVAAFIRFLHESLPYTSGQWFQLDSRDSLI
jgi:NAD(P)-dependent dehydrogenase (short-subunit alcohol dehydrogenase family)